MCFQNKCRKPKEEGESNGDDGTTRRDDDNVNREPCFSVCDDEKEGLAGEDKRLNYSQIMTWGSDFTEIRPASSSTTEPLFSITSFPPSFLKLPSIPICTVSPS